jgi:hypothetical protein
LEKWLVLMRILAPKLGKYSDSALAV